MCPPASDPRPERRSETVDKPGVHGRTGHRARSVVSSTYVTSVSHTTALGQRGRPAPGYAKQALSAVRRER
ncbi:hypothetical protein CU044_5577 [Streptomyces sp. L-9-10]|nr:hypothetical protein CU044_5577 [Streptomyces sp. L-9-10]